MTKGSIIVGTPKSAHEQWAQVGCLIWGIVASLRHFESASNLQLTWVPGLNTQITICISSILDLFKGLRLTAGRRPSNDVWLMVWEDWAEIRRARHNALACMEAVLAYVEPSRAHVLGSAWVHVEPTLGPCWPMLGLCWPMLSPLGSYVGAKFGPSMLKRS